MMRVVVFSVCFLVSCFGLLLPNQGIDGTFPRTPPGYDIRVIGSLGSETNKKIPIIVFLHAMLEEHSAERVEWFERLAQTRRASFVLPIAGKKFVESRSQRIRTWFDFKGTIRTPSNLIGYEESFDFIAGIVRSLQRLDRPLYLAGYGQGGALAMDVALSDASKIKPVNGVAVFSSYFITHENFSHDALVETPVFWAHSQRDTKIPFSMAKYGYEKQLVEILQCAHSQFLIFENKAGHGHEFNEESVDVLMRFVEKGLPVKL